MIDAQRAEPHGLLPRQPRRRGWRSSARRRDTAAAIGALVVSLSVFAASCPATAAAIDGDAAAVRATYTAMNQLWDLVSPISYCGDDRACLRAGADEIAEVAAGLVPPLVRALRTAGTSCIVRTANDALVMARLARTGARKTLKGSRNTIWPGAVIDHMYTVQMSANSCFAWGGGL